MYLKDSIFVVYSIYVIYIRCGCGLGLVYIYMYMYIYILSLEELLSSIQEEKNQYLKPYM